MGMFDDVLGTTEKTAQKPGQLFDDVLNPKPPGTLRQLGTQLGAGAVVDLPRMVGQAAQAFSTEGSTATRLGKEMVAGAEQRAPNWEPDLTDKNEVQKALITGSRSIAPSLATVGAYAVPYAGAVLGPAATLGLYGGSQYQDTYEKAKLAGNTDEQAYLAGLGTGAVQGGGEALANKITLGLFGAGKNVAKAGIQGLTDTSVIKPFAKSLGVAAVGEPATEVGQDVGTALIERNQGIPTAPLGETAYQSLTAALGMTALLSPLGLGGHVNNARRVQNRNNVLSDTTKAPEERINAANELHAQAKQIGIADADLWHGQALSDINAGRPVSLSNPVRPEGPLTRARSQAPGQTQAELDAQVALDAQAQAAAQTGATNVNLGGTATAVNRPVTATGEAIDPAGIQRTGNAEYQSVNRQIGTGNNLANGVDTTGEGQLPGRNGPVPRGVEPTTADISGLESGQPIFTRERGRKIPTEEGGQAEGQPIIPPDNAIRENLYKSLEHYNLPENQARTRVDDAIAEAEKLGLDWRKTVRDSERDPVDAIEHENKRKLIQSRGPRWESGIAAQEAFNSPLSDKVREEWSKAHIKQNEDGSLARIEHNHFGTWYEGGGVSPDIGQQYDAHGIAKSNQLGSLLNLLRNGVNSGQRFDTAALTTPSGSSTGRTSGGAYKDGAFIVMGPKGQAISDAGIKNVLVSDSVSNVIPALQKEFPHINFIPYSNAQAELSKQSAPAATLTQPELTNGKAKKQDTTQASKTLLETQAPENKPLGAFTPTHTDPADDTKLMHLGGNDYLDQEKFDKVQKGEAVDPWTFNPEDVAPYEAPTKTTKADIEPQQPTQRTNPPITSVTSVSEETPTQPTRTAEGVVAGLTQPEVKPDENIKTLDQVQAKQEEPAQATETAGATEGLTVQQGKHELPRSVNTEQKKRLYNADEHIKKAETVLPYTQQSIGHLPSIEHALSEFDRLNDWVKDADGRLLKGGKVAGGLTTKDLLNGWSEAAQLSNTIEKWKQDYPNDFANYESNQKQVEKLNVGDTALFPNFGARENDPIHAEGVIVKKNPKNWIIKSNKSGVELTLQPTALKTQPTPTQPVPKVEAQPKQEPPWTPKQEPPTTKQEPSQSTTAVAGQKPPQEVPTVPNATTESLAAKGNAALATTAEAPLFTKNGQPQTFKTEKGANLAIQLKKAKETHTSVQKGDQWIVQEKATAQPTAKAEPVNAESELSTEAQKYRSAEKFVDAKFNEWFMSLPKAEQSRLTANNTERMAKFNELKNKLTPIWKASRKENPVTREVGRATEGTQKVAMLNAARLIWKEGDITYEKGTVWHGKEGLSLDQLITQLEDKANPAQRWLLEPETRDLAIKESEEANKLLHELKMKSKGFMNYQESHKTTEQPAPEAKSQAQPEALIAKVETIKGNKVALVTPKNDMQVAAHYAVVPLEQLITSHDTNLNINPAYPKEMQPRIRTAKSYALDLQNKVASFNPELVGASITTDTGAPLISDTGIVVSGNGRTISLNKIYTENKANAKQYQDWLQTNAKQFGFNPTDFKGITNPVLVRVIDDKAVDLLDLSRKSNELSIKEMSAVEQAFSDANSAPDEVFANYDGGTLQSNPSFLKAFIQATNADNIYDDNGALSQKGEDRINAAIMAKAYGHNKIVADLYENTDTEVKSLLNGLLKASSDWIKLRAAFIATGTPDLTDNLTDAVMLVKKARASKGQTVKSLINQTDLMSEGTVHPVTEQFAKLFFYDDQLTKYIAGDKVAGILSATAQNMAKQLVNTDMFGETLTVKQILDAVYEQYIKTKPTTGKTPTGYLGDLFNPITLRGDRKSQSESWTTDQGQGTGAVGDKTEEKLKSEQPVKAEAKPKPEKKRLASLLKGSEPLFIASDKQYSIVAFPDNKTGTGRLNATESDVTTIAQRQKNITSSTTQQIKSWIAGKKRLGELLKAGKLRVVSNINQLSEAELHGGEVLYHKVWHGSPHSHDKFDSSKIGTGEGAQVFGFGHYFTDLKSIGEYYRDTLAEFKMEDANGNNVATPTNAREWEVWQLLRQYKGDFAKVRQYIAEGYSGNLQKAFTEIADDFENKGYHMAEDRAGKLYEVELAPTQDEYLDWNNNGWDQSEKVISALKKEGILSDKLVFGKTDTLATLATTGEGIYRALTTKYGSDKAASDYLHSLGIRGIRYAAEGGKSEAKNYVIFSDADISITNKYSKANQGAEGLYNPRADKLYLFSDNLNESNRESVLAHELLHRAEYTDPKLKKALEQFESDLQSRFNLNAKGLGSKTELAAYKRVIASNTPLNSQLEEYRAYLVSEYLKAPQSFTGKLLKAIKDFFAAIRIALVRAGMNFGFVSKLTPSDLFAMSKYGSRVQSQAAPQWSGQTALASAQAERFYSALHRALITAPDKIFGNAAQVKLWLNSNAPKFDVKKDEIYWSGINDFLDIRAANKEKVTKADMDAFMREQGTVRVEDVMLGSNKKNTDTYRVQRLDDNNFSVIDVNGDVLMEGFKTENKANYWIDEQGKADTKHGGGSLVIPGGRDYKELVITIPTIEKFNESDATHFGDVSKGKAVSWVRMDTRTDANGNDTLFLEEVQSQRSQKGRKDGFSYLANKWQAEFQTGDVAYFNNEADAKKAEKQGATVTRVTVPGVPPAPFVTDANNKATNAYISLLLKKAISHAIDNGQSSVSWTTGDQQADRYDLSKQINEINYLMKNNGTYDITASDKQDYPFIENKNYTKSELENTFGNELSKKIIDGEGEYKQLKGWTISGEGLKVGGAWTQSMYGDETGMNAQGKPAMITQAAMEIARKMGGEVGSVEFKGEPTYREILDMLGDFDKYPEGSKQRAELEVKQKTAGDDSSQVLRGKQPALIITSAMKAKILAEGMPLFSKSGGLEDGTSNNVRFSVRSEENTEPHTPEVDTWLSKWLNRANADTAIYNLQDRYIDLYRQMQKITKQGGVITESENARMGEEVSHQRIQSRIKEFYDTQFNPILKELHDNKIDMDAFQTVLQARHAPSRNEVMAERNPNQEIIDEKLADAEQALEDAVTNKEKQQASTEIAKWSRAKPFKGTEEERLSLSGMMDAQAKKTLDDLTPEQKRVMLPLADKIDAINNNTLDLMVDYEMETPESIQALKDQWEHYVPLHRDEAHPEDSNFGHPIGRGFSIRGTGLRTATGSNAEVTNIMAHIAAAREQMLRRGEKNKVTVQLADFVTNHPDPTFAVTEPLPTKDYLVNGLVETLPDPTFKDKNNVVVYRLNGKDKAIIFNEYAPENVRLAMALKNMNGIELDKVESLIAKGTRWLASVNTQFNVVFGIMNVTRDVQGAMLNLSSTPLAGKQRTVMSKMVDSVKIIAGVERGWAHTDPALKAMYERFNKAGGTTAYSQMFEGVKDRDHAIRNELKKLGEGKAMRMGRAIGKALSDFNTVMENSTRLAVFMTGIESGLSDRQAASLAKNITVNFNRKGAYTTKVGSMYAFFNASMQGSFRMAETLKGPRGKQILIGGVGLGAALTLLGIAAMGADDWDKIPEFIRERSLIIPAPWNSAGYIAIPMPLGFHILPNVGRKFVESMLGSDRISPTKRFAQLASTSVGAFNPLGGSDISSLLMPTVLDPALALWRNQDWTGKTVYQQDFNTLDPTPGFSRAKDTATTPARWAAKLANQATGGTDYIPGLWSPTPDQIDYVVGQITGGTGREMMKAQEMFASIGTAEELPTYKIPLIGRLYGTVTGDAAERSAYYENVKLLNTYHNEVEGLRKEPGGYVKAQQYLQENPIARVYNRAHMIQRMIDNLKKRPGNERRINELMKKQNELVQAAYG